MYFSIYTSMFMTLRWLNHLNIMWLNPSMSGINYNLLLKTIGFSSSLFWKLSWQSKEMSKDSSGSWSFRLFTMSFVAFLLTFFFLNKMRLKRTNFKLKTLIKIKQYLTASQQNMSQDTIQAIVIQQSYWSFLWTPLLIIRWKVVNI